MNDTPNQDVFNEIKEEAIRIWKTYDDEHGYVTQKVEAVNSIRNYQDNWYGIVGMFDQSNQKKLMNGLSGEAHDLVRSVVEYRDETYGRLSL